MLLLSGIKERKEAPLSARLVPYFCQTNVAGRQKREYIGLQASHEQFQAIHENTECDRNNRHADVYPNAHRDGDKDQTRQCQDNRVPCHDVGKQTDHQGERLGEYAEELDEWHDRNRQLQEDRRVGPEDVFPISLRPEQVDGQERTNGQNHSDSDVARHVRSARKERNNADQIINKDEKEHGQQIGREGLVVPLSDAFPDHVLFDVIDHRLHHAHKAAWRFARMLLIPTGGLQNTY